MSSEINKECFLISPIGSDGYDIRRQADQVLRHIISPAVRDCDFEAIHVLDWARPQEVPATGLYRNQIHDKTVVTS